tara:strand:+ start:124 stop:657 length:534 start_codon:yes stop_codon:yes gene_type:complete
MKNIKATELQKKQKKKLNEKDVTKDVLQWAGLRGKTVRLFRMQTTGIPDGKGGFRTNNEKGSPDFIGAYQMAKIPVLFAFEIKSPTGKQSDSQKNWQKRAEGFGINYFIIKSWEEAESAIQKIHKKHARKISYSFLGPAYPEHVELEKDLWTELKSSTGEVKRTTRPSTIPDPKNKK